MPAMNCPTRDELVEFAMGSLPDAAIESVTDHLEACADCELTVSELEAQSDTLIGHLREPVEPSPHAGEAEFERAVAAIKKIGRSPRGNELANDATQSAGVAQLRDYRLLSKLGVGGMGTVYKALHTKLERVVALKILPEHRSDPSSVSRFEREIAAVAKLNHPNIVSAFDAGEDEGMHYLVMELVEGIDLNRLVRKVGPLPVADACEITRQAALGLQHASDHGLVHRDIKPSNLMLAKVVEGGAARVESKKALDAGLSTLDSHARVKVLDLGLALRQSDALRHENLTNTGQVMGTLDYMAPEQANDSHNVDIRADIYSLGCTLYKLLTGVAPFGGDDYHTPVKKIMAHANAVPSSVQQHRADVPDDLASLVDQMLAKDPNARPTSPADVAAALETFAADHKLQELSSQVADESIHDDRIASAAEIPVLLSGGDRNHINPIRRRMLDGDEPSFRLRPAHYVWGGAIALGLTCMFMVIMIGELTLAIEAASGTMNPAESLAREVGDATQYGVFCIPTIFLSIFFFVRGYRWHRRAMNSKDLPIEKMPEYFVPVYWKLSILVGVFILVGMFQVAAAPNHRSYLTIETDHDVRLEITRDGQLDKIVTLNNQDSVQLKPGRYDLRLLDDEKYRLDKSRFKLGVDKEVYVRVIPIPKMVKWTPSKPVLLESMDRTQGDNQRLYGHQPLDFVWNGPTAILVTESVSDDGDVTSLWQENYEGGWQLLRKVEGIVTSHAVAIEGGVGLIGIKNRASKAKGLVDDSVEEPAEEPTDDGEEDQGPMMVHQFVRVVGGKASEPVVVFEKSDSWNRVVGLHGDGEKLFLLLMHRDFNRKNELLFFRSDDGGRTWQEPKLVTDQHQCPQHVTRLSIRRADGDMFCMMLDQRLKPWIFASHDKGKTWVKSEVKYRDDFEDDGLRMPVGLFEFGQKLSMIYIAADDDPAAEIFGSYVLSQSTDDGKSWSNGVAITKPIPLLEPGMMIDAVSIEDTIYMTFVEVNGESQAERRKNWTDGNWVCQRLVSKDGGKTWAQSPLKLAIDVGTPIFNRITASPEQARILFAADVKIESPDKFNLMVETLSRE